MDRASRLRMAYTEVLLRSYSRKMADWKPVVQGLEALCRDPRGAQEGTLRAILSLHAASAYGRAHGFEQIADYEGFRRRVPVVDYEGLRPYVARMLEGEADVLVRGAAAYFSTTSGSTASPKFIPGTQPMIVAGCDAILARSAYLLRDHPGAFRGRPLVIVGCMDEGRTAAGVTYGAMTGFGYHVTHMGFPGGRFPYELFTVRDYDARYYALLRVALGARDLSAVFVYNPSTLLRLVETARERWDELVDDLGAGGLSPRHAVPAEVREALGPWLAPDPGRAAELRGLGRESLRAWWPALSVLVCWKAGAAGYYLEDLRPHLGGLPVRELGLLASEATVTIAVDDGPGGVVLPESGFFEFVPEGEDEARPAWELETGARYRLVVTTPGGLYRYDLGDMVRVIGHHREMPRIEFLHRAGRVYSFTGEKLTEYHVTHAVRAAADACGLRLAGFAAVPTWSRPPFYRLFVEAAEAGSPGAWAELAGVVDDELHGTNIEYADKRRSGRLEALVVARVPSGSFDRLRRAKGNDAQYKEVHLATDPAYGAELSALAEVA